MDLRGSTDIPPQIIVKIFKPCGSFEITFQRKFLCHFQAIIEPPSLNCFVIFTTYNVHTYLGSGAFVFSFPCSSAPPPPQFLPAGKSWFKHVTNKLMQIVCQKKISICNLPFLPFPMIPLVSEIKYIICIDDHDNMTNFYYSITYSFSLKPAVPLILEHNRIGFYKIKRNHL